MSQIALLGTTGFLGSFLLKTLVQSGIQVDSLDRKVIDLSADLNVEELKNLLKNKKYKYIVVAAAITDVELCYKNPELAENVNVVNTIKVIQAASNLGIIPIFFSSDYVFGDHKKIYLDLDECRPTTVYGEQKLKVENFIKENISQYLIFRTSKLISKTQHQKNIILQVVKALNENKTVNSFTDQWLNPVFVEDIAAVLELSIKNNLSGIYNLGCDSVYSRYDFNIKIASAMGLDQNLIKPISMKDIQFSEKRPNYNVLDTKLIQSKLDFKFEDPFENKDYIKSL